MIGREETGLGTLATQPSGKSKILGADRARSAGIAARFVSLNDGTRKTSAASCKVTGADHWNRGSVFGVLSDLVDETLLPDPEPRRLLVSTDLS